MDEIYKHISIDPAIQNGQPVFAGTDILVTDLFLHIEKELAIEEFLEDHPALKKEQLMAVINFSTAMIEEKKKGEV